ncbi:MAG: glycosyltransferase [Candidatus Magasanikbacteria bacterium]
MKILHLIPTYRPAYSRGGPIWSVHNLNKQLAKKGVDIDLYTTDIDISEGKVPLNKKVDVDGIDVTYFPESKNIFDYRSVGFIPYFFPRRWEYSRDMHLNLKENISKFDLVHITSTFLTVSTLGAYYANQHNIPYVISLRGNFMSHIDQKNSWGKKIYSKLIESYALKHAKALHTTVELEKEQYLNRSLPKNDFVTIPNGLDLDELDKNVEDGSFRDKHNIDANRPIVLFLSRIDWKKGLDTLIPAMKKVIDEIPDCLLVIAGSGDDQHTKEMKDLVREQNLEDNVYFAGWVEGKQKTAAFKDADLFALSSYSENFGMAVVEAMYYKLPVLITPEVGVSKEVQRAQAGKIIKKDEEEFGKKIIELLEDKEQRNEMGRNGKRLVDKKFAMSEIADQWQEAYQNILSGSVQN